MLHADQYADIVVGTSIADHADGLLFQGIQYLGAVAVLLGGHIAHYADDALIRIDLHGTQFAKVVEDRFKIGGVVDCERYAYFGGGYHIDGGLVLIEHLEQSGQKTAGQKHTAADDLDGCDVVLGCDGFHAHFV